MTNLEAFSGSQSFLIVETNLEALNGKSRMNSSEKLKTRRAIYSSGICLIHGGVFDFFSIAKAVEVQV
jgi:hypothetical protein